MKVHLNSQVSTSRLPSYLPRFLLKEIIPDQVADIVLRKEKKAGYSLIYLPLDYHRQNPGYLQHMIDKNEEERRKTSPPSILLVILLCQKQQEIVIIDQAQMICLKKNVNVMLCYDLKEVANVIVDLLQMK